MRLDQLLVKQYPKYSRSFLQRFIRERGVQIKEKKVKKGNFNVSDPVILPDIATELDNFEQGLVRSIRRQTMERKILYENDDFVVIDKTPGVTTEAIVADLFSVHRLDKDTSGVLVAAKNPHTQASLQAQWKQRKVEKIYIALVKGHLAPRRGAIEAHLARSTSDRRKMALSSSSDARFALTEYTVLKYVLFPTIKDEMSLVEVRIHTGRTHQIRVHFKSIGYPVIGDKVYGDAYLNKKIEQTCGLRRQFLHAHKLGIKNPSTGKKQTFVAPLPQDLRFI